MTYSWKEERSRQAMGWRQLIAWDFHCIFVFLLSGRFGPLLRILLPTTYTMSDKKSATAAAAAESDVDYTLNNPDVVTKYKDAAEISNRKHIPFYPTQTDLFSCPFQLYQYLFSENAFFI